MQEEEQDVTGRETSLKDKRLININNNQKLRSPLKVMEIKTTYCASVEGFLNPLSGVQGGGC